MRKFIAIGATVVSAIAAMSAGPSTALASESLSTAPPDGVTLEVAAAAGTGCKPGTAAISVSPDANEFSVTYGSFVAQVGVGAASSDRRKNCQLNLIVQYPQGYSYAITGVDHRGVVSLAAGASAVLRTQYYFTGQAATLSTTHKFSGPHDDSWLTTDNSDVASLVFSPCGVQRNLNINTDLTMSVGTSDPATTTSLMTVDETVIDIYRFVWRQCN